MRELDASYPGVRLRAPHGLRDARAISRALRGARSVARPPALVRAGLARCAEAARPASRAARRRLSSDAFPGGDSPIIGDASWMPRCCSTSTGRCALCRRFEEAAGTAYAQGKIGGFLHLYIGQEAVAVGAISARAPTDYVVATYREHGHYLARRATRAAPWPSSTARRPAASKGLGGSMHLFDAEQRFLGGYGIVGGHVPIAAGVAFASKYRGDGDVTLCFFGDGAVNHGRVPRGPRARGAVEAADRLHLREQPVLDGHAALPHAGGRGRRRCARAATASRRAIVRTATTSSRCASASPRRSSARATTSEPTLVEVDDLPLPRPLDVRPGQVPHEGRGRGVEEARSDRSRSGAAHADARHRDRGASSTQLEDEVEGRGEGRGRVRRDRRPPPAPETVDDHVDV